MTAQPQEARLVIDGKVSHLQSEVSEEVCRLQDQANTEISRLQAEVNEKILCIRTEVGAKVSSLKATFGQEKSRLNCQRNTLSPVYRLPPELLSSIFFTSLTTSQKSKYVSYINPDARIHNMISQPNRDRLSGFEPWASVPDSLRLCHVCQYWRSVALGSPSLWKHIQVGQRMSSQLLQFMRANARHAPLTIDVDCPNYISLFKIRPLDVLSDVIDTGLKQLRSLAICCNKPAFAHIEPCLSTALTADQLESLQLVVHGPTGQETNIFPTGTPNLKRLDLRGVVIPWSSTVLRSPHLTHLALHHIPDLDASAMAELLSFLRHATKLVSVHLDLPQQATLTWEDVGGQLRTPVKLPNIEILQLISKSYAPLPIMMKVLCPEDMLQIDLKMLCSEADRHLQPICELSHPGHPPEQVEIGYRRTGPIEGFIVSCDFQSVFCECGGRIWHSPGHEPWIVINTGTAFPFPSLGSTKFRVPWSFTNLHVFVVDNIADSNIPVVFWEELAALPTLQIIHMKWARITLVARMLQAMLTSSKRPDPHSTSATPNEGSNAEPVSHPFPALRALVFDSLGRCAKDCSRDLRNAGWGVTEAGKQVSSMNLYLRWVASKLRPWRDYGHRYVSHLTFRADGVTVEGAPDHESQEMFKAIDDYTLRSLKAVALNITFGRRLIWDYNADKRAKAATASANTSTAGEGQKG